MTKQISNAQAIRNQIAVVKGAGGTQKDVQAWAVKKLGMTSSMAGQYTKNNWDKVTVVLETVVQEKIVAPVVEVACETEIEEEIKSPTKIVHFDEDYNTDYDAAAAIDFHCKYSGFGDFDGGFGNHFNADY